MKQKKKVEQKKTELIDLSNKFRELKSLVYDYRDKKEGEINELNERHNNLKSEISGLELNTLDIDLLDQKARKILGLTGKDEIIIYEYNE